MAFSFLIVFLSYVPDFPRSSPTGPTLLLLAAGMGSRYGGLKQLDAMGPNGETLLDYAIFDAQKAGFTKVVFVIRKSMAHEFEGKIARRYQDRLSVEWVFQEQTDLPNGLMPPRDRQRPWGTGHAVLAARSCIREPFAVINADDYYGPSAYQLLAQVLNRFSAEEILLSCIAYPLKLTLSENGSVNRGVCTIENNQLQSIEEWTNIQAANGEIQGLSPSGKQSLPPEQLVSMNCWGMTPALFPIMEAAFASFIKELKDPLQDEFYLPAFINGLLGQREICCSVYPAQDRWCGVTYPNDKVAVRQQLQNAHQSGLYPHSLCS